MKLFRAPQTRALRAIWMLEEAGVKYDLELVDIRDAGRHDSAEFLAASPMAKVPALVDGEAAMAEKFNEVEAARARSGWGDFDTMIKTFDRALQDKDWILGDQFTAADVMLGSSAIFLRQFNMLPATCNIGDYADRCLAREGYQRALGAAGE